VFREIARALPQYDYVYFGDNARAPYGPRDFETIYRYTLECVEHLFAMGCPLVILACNTASAKALRSIQQQDLPVRHESWRRVLGVIRPTTELVGSLTESKKVGIVATTGTVQSRSYPIEIAKFWPDVQVFQQACPLWVPLIENGEQDGDGADFFVEKYLQQLFAQSSDIDTLVLGCTHYPLMFNKIRAHTPEHIRLVSQGDIVAHSLVDYLQRHPDLAARCSTGGTRRFFTTESPVAFEAAAGAFFGAPVQAEHFEL
jgi:glutamate racemase